MKHTVARWLGTPARKVLAAVLAVVIVAAVIAVIASTGTSSSSIRTSQQRIDVPAGKGLSGSVSLDTTLYVPQHTPAPAILLAHGFGGSKDSVVGDAQRLAQAGFVVLAYSARGFGASTGQIGLDSLDYEVPDASRLIDWLATRPEVQLDKPGDPRVGVTGGSYGGALSLMLAGTDPRIDADVPVITWNDLSQSLFPNSVEASTAPGPSPAAMAGQSDGVFKKAWAASLISSVISSTDLTGAAGTAPTDNGDSGFGRGSQTSSPASSNATGDSSNNSSPTSAADDSTGPSTSAVAAGCGRLMPTLCAAYGQAAQTGRLTPSFVALLDRSSPKTVASNIKAPTLLVQGEKDTLFGLDQADANARQIAASGTTVAMTWYDGGHSGGTEPDAVTENRITAWFQHYLSGTRPVPDTGFVYSVDGPLSDNGQARTRTLRTDSYPGLTSGAAPRVDVPLSGSAQLVINPPGGSPAAITSLPGISGLSGTALASFAGGLPGQTATFAAAPVSSATVITGAARVSISISALPAAAQSADTSGVVLFGSLTKVTATGVRTIAGTAVAPIRITGLTPGGPAKTVTVDLPAVAFQVEAGSHVEVRFSTTDQGFAGPTAPAAYRIALAGSDGVNVPEVGGVRISAGEVPTAALVGLIVLAVLIVLALIVGGRVRRRRPMRYDADSTDTASALPLVISGLAKRYPGGVAAVQDVSFEVRPGQVLGLLGPNGAGKTTTLRMVMGLIIPTDGDIKVFGETVQPGAPILSRIGSFVEGSGFLPHLSGRANLELYWRATGRPPGDAHLDEALEIAGLGGAIKRRVKTYSQGMRQRLAIAQAMLGLPDLLLLDEPTNGLDPPQIHAMREVLRRYATTGRTVLVSSHLLSEVEQTCSHVVVVHQGRTIASGTVADLVSASGELMFTVDDADRAAAVLRGMDGVSGVVVESLPGEPGALRADVGPAASVAVAALVRAGVAVSGVAPKNRLEDVFLTLIGGGRS